MREISLDFVGVNYTIIFQISVYGYQYICLQILRVLAPMAPFLNRPLILSILVLGLQSLFANLIGSIEPICTLANGAPDPRKWDC